MSLPGKFHRQKTLVSYSPWGCRVGHDWACSLLYQCKVLTVILFLVPPGGRGLDSTIPPAARGFCPCFGESFLFFLPKQTNLASIYLPELWIFVCALVSQRPYAPFPVAEVFDSQERKVWEWRWGSLPVFLLPLITSWCLCPSVLRGSFSPSLPSNTQSFSSEAGGGEVWAPANFLYGWSPQPFHSGLLVHTCL